MPRESRTTYRPGTKGRAFRGATLIRRCRTCVTGGRGSPCVRFADGPWRSALPCIAGALRRSLLGGGSRCRAARRSRSVRRLPGPFAAAVAPGFHQPPGLSADARRVLVPFIARLRDVGGVCGWSRGASSGRGGSWVGRTASSLTVPFWSRSGHDGAFRGGSGTHTPGSRARSARTPRFLRKRDHWTRGDRSARIRCIE